MTVLPGGRTAVTCSSSTNDSPVAPWGGGRTGLHSGPPERPPAGRVTWSLRIVSSKPQNTFPLQAEEREEQCALYLHTDSHRHVHVGR
ncbi:hypothetical protein EYF80_055095 [Liparis tanakae]|uniref:Uncharacterized protein n=1 Tax=Liparis tanakae TaxID=230148 RepID=A0A4Z2F133_9TELE|nr:hypothetical protein EYF80_055095 [Liparis tanakae]